MARDRVGFVDDCYWALSRMFSLAISIEWRKWGELGTDTGDQE